VLEYAPRRGGRVVEGARLESVYTATYRGFESLPLRHTFYRQATALRVVHCATKTQTAFELTAFLLSDCSTLGSVE
jgi:hypothetical protein